MRTTIALAATALAVLVPAAHSQTPAPRAEVADVERAVHALPFASEGNMVELSVGAPDGTADPLGAVAVRVVESPTWLAFRETQVEAERAGSTGKEALASEPVASLAFDVSEAAPVGEPADIVFRVLSTDGTVLGVHTVRVEVGAPTALSIGLPRPNPSRSAARLDLVVPAAGSVRASAFDVLGREVAVLADAPLPPGAHTLRLDTGSLAAGTYVVRVVAEGDGGERSAEVRRLTVVR